MVDSYPWQHRIRPADDAGALLAAREQNNRRGKFKVRGLVIRPLSLHKLVAKLTKWVPDTAGYRIMQDRIREGSLYGFVHGGA